MQNTEKNHQNGDLIKGNSTLSTIDMSILREKFIIDYSKEKGWDESNLTQNQLLEIIEQPQYKSPGMIKS